MAIPRSTPRGCRRRWAPSAWYFVLPALLGLGGVAQGESPATTQGGLVHEWSDARPGLDRSNGAEVRLRAIARLGASRDPRAPEALAAGLAQALTPSPPASTRAAREVAEPERLYLAFAYALAAHADHLDARRALVRLVTSVADGTGPLDALAAGVAANALALSGTPDALEALGRALQQRGPVSEIAARALTTHPPRELAPLIENATMNRALIELLGELGDQRAFLPLREVVRTGPTALRSSAAWALYRLGAMETEELARHWWKTSQVPSERVVALRILTESGDPLAIEALTRVLTEAKTDPAPRPLLDAALEHASRAPRKAWEQALLALYRGADDRRRELLLTALARLDTEGARAFFTAALAGSDAPRAADALARSSDGVHDHVLVRVLSSPPARVWALRSLAVRLRRMKSPSASLREAFERAAAKLSTSASGTERAAAAWSRAVAEPERLTVPFVSPDETSLRAAARQAFEAPLAMLAAARLARAGGSGLSPALIEALSPCLRNRSAERMLTTQTLQRLAADATTALPSFASVLSARSAVAAPWSETSATNWQEVRTWLGAADPALRAAAARGLGFSAEPASVTLLTELLRWDPEPTVRRAAARALRWRPEAAASQALPLSSSLDPDPIVRALSQRGTAPVDESPGRPSLAWLTNTQGPVRLTTAWGESLLVHPDPDGFAGVVDFGPEPLVVAKLERAREALSRPPAP